MGFYSNCGNCKREVGVEEGARATCDACHTVFHGRCVGLPNSYRKLCYKGSFWLCGGCSIAVRGFIKGEELKRKNVEHSSCSKVKGGQSPSGVKGSTGNLGRKGGDVKLVVKGFPAGVKEGQVSVGVKKGSVAVQGAGDPVGVKGVPAGQKGRVVSVGVNRDSVGLNEGSVKVKIGSVGIKGGVCKIGVKGGQVGVDLAVGSVGLNERPLSLGGKGDAYQRGLKGGLLNRVGVFGDSMTRNLGSKISGEVSVNCYPGCGVKKVRDSIVGSRVSGCEVVWVGTNDIGDRRSIELESKFSELVKTLEGRDSMSIVVGVLPRVRESNEWLSRAQSLNDFLEKECKKAGIMFVNNWDTFWGSKYLYKYDGIHLNDKGKQIVADKIQMGINSFLL